MTLPHGAYQWFWTRSVGVLLIPVGIWFLWFLAQIKNKDPAYILNILQNPFEGFMLIFLICLFGVHSYLGLKEVTIDYITNSRTQTVLSWVWLIFLITTSGFLILMVGRNIAL